MFVLFVAQLGAHGPLWAIELGPRPIVGYRTRPKAQPIRGLGWVGPGPTWALLKSNPALLFSRMEKPAHLTVARHLHPPALALQAVLPPSHCQSQSPYTMQAVAHGPLCLYLVHRRLGQDPGPQSPKREINTIIVRPHL